MVLGAAKSPQSQTGRLGSAGRSRATEPRQDLGSLAVCPWPFFTQVSLEPPRDPSSSSSSMAPRQPRSCEETPPDAEVLEDAPPSVSSSWVLDPPEAQQVPEPPGPLATQLAVHPGDTGGGVQQFLESAPPSASSAWSSGVRVPGPPSETPAPPLSDSHEGPIVVMKAPAPGALLRSVQGSVAGGAWRTSCP